MEYHSFMTPAANKPAPIHCIEQERLMHEYSSAVSECNRLQSASVLAVKRGDAVEFEELVAKANERRENAKYAILAHREEHGC